MPERVSEVYGVEIVFSGRCLEYSYFGHVESPERVRKASEILKKFGYVFLEPEPAPEQDLLRVHTKDWVERVKSVCKTPCASLKRFKGNFMIPPNMLRNLAAQLPHSTCLLPGMRRIQNFRCLRRDNSPCLHLGQMPP